jgi:hypothetical protein
MKAQNSFVCTCTRSLKNLDLPQARFLFVPSPSLPSPANNSHLSKIFLHVIKLSHFGPANTTSSFRFAHIQFFGDPVFWHPFYVNQHSQSCKATLWAELYLRFPVSDWINALCRQPNGSNRNLISVHRNLTVATRKVVSFMSDCFTRYL